MPTTIKFFVTTRLYWLLCALVLLLSACANTYDTHPDDPFERWNREVDVVNKALDDVVLKPVAKTYDWVMPDPLVIGIRNFFGNLGEIWSIPNSLLQLKVPDAIESTMRVTVNIVFGMGGVLDIATAVGMQRHNEDLGQTLGYWGVPSGPYIVIPFFGPSTLRDLTGRTVENLVSTNAAFAHVVAPHSKAAVRNSLDILEIVDKRLELLPVTNFAEENALDLYVFVRDAYLQNRQSLVLDGVVITDTGTDIEIDINTVNPAEAQ